ncbi:MAG: hypothetical protein J0I67_15525 [Bosea sp.]|nr:hypothetical protein [Bosea sp. (in: a-proteobacteria)]
MPIEGTAGRYVAHHQRISAIIDATSGFWRLKCENVEHSREFPRFRGRSGCDLAFRSYDRDRKKVKAIGGAMHDQLIRLDKASLRQMKRDASAVFTCVSHAQALEAMARGLGANSFNDLRRYAREYGAILWDQSEDGAATFLAMRGSSMEAGDLAWIVEDHVIDHEAIPGFDVWIRGAAGAPGTNRSGVTKA